MRRHDASNSGYIADEAGPQAEVDTLWEVQVDQGAFSESAVVESTVYAGGYDGQVHALATDDGSERWTARTDAPVTSTPTVMDGSVYVLNSSDPALGEGVGILRALATEDGDEQWQFETDGNVLGMSPAVAGGRVFLGVRGHAYAVNATDGRVAWHTELDDVRDDVDSSYNIQADAVSPAVHDGTVYIGGKQVVALDAESGDPQWTASTGSARPVNVSDGLVFAVRDTSVMALQASDGTEAWTTEPDIDLRSPCASDGTRLYVGGRVLPDADASQAGRVVSLAADDGTVAWKTKTEASVWAAPTITTESIYVATGNPSSRTPNKALRAWNATDGAPIWTVETGKSSYTAPAIVDSIIYANGGTINALGT